MNLNNDNVARKSRAVRAILGCLIACQSILCAADYYVSPKGNESESGLSPDNALSSIQTAINLAQPGDTVHLSEGIYREDVITVHDGSSTSPISITGPREAILIGDSLTSVVTIHHSHIVLDGFTIDGLRDDPTEASNYSDKLITVSGNTPLSGPNGVRILRMRLLNSRSESVRIRYFAQHNELAYNIIRNSGRADFRFNDGGKNGEGIYIGTSPTQLANGLNPTSHPDESSYNWIHHNDINTQGNESVDLKEATTGTIVEHNRITGNLDAISAGIGIRSNSHIIRNNDIFGNLGAGIRLGGTSEADGVNNTIVRNFIHSNAGGGIKFQRGPQTRICGNIMSSNTGGDSVGTFKHHFDPAVDCDDLPTPTIFPKDTRAPATPQDLAVNVSIAGTNLLAWQGSRGDSSLVGYQVYRNGILLGLTGATVLIDRSFSAHTTNTYQVQAIDTHGNLSALSVPLIVEPIDPSSTFTFQGQNGTVVMEAEHFSSTQAVASAGWVTTTEQPGFLAEAAMIALPNTGLRANAQAKNFQDVSPLMSYQFHVSTSGTYTVWVRGYGPSGSDDSIYLSINDEPIETLSLTKGAWGWKQALATRISPGNHRLNIWMREDGCLADRIVITKDSSNKPFGPGPKESPRTFVNGSYLLPTVRITTPSAEITDAVVNIPITISATATDPDGTIQEVQIRANDQEICHFSTAPYTCQWTPTEAGNFTITAFALDDADAQTISLPIQVTVIPSGPPASPRAGTSAQPLSPAPLSGISVRMNPLGNLDLLLAPPLPMAANEMVYVEESSDLQYWKPVLDQSPPSERKSAVRFNFNRVHLMTLPAPERSTFYRLRVDHLESE